MPDDSHNIAIERNGAKKIVAAFRSRRADYYLGH